jgi:hypothetical protein
VLGDGEILIGDASGDPATLDVGSSTAITILGTVATGVWNGTAIANANLANSSVSYGGISVSLGASDATPAFDLADATGYGAGDLAGATLASGVTASSLTSVGTLTSLATSGDITLNTTQKVHLDGGSGTYIAETSTNVIGLVADNNENFQIKTTGVGIPAGKKVWLDGDLGTYIAETAGNVIGIVCDNNETLRVGVSGIGIKTAPNATYALDSAGAVRLTGLPTSDPSVAGALYVVSGDLRVST